MAKFREEFERVRAQVVMGNAHLELWTNLSKRLGKDPKRLAANAAPTFFGMTLESHLNTAILHAARIFDTHRDSLNIRRILKRAHVGKGSLSVKVAKELEVSLRKANKKLPFWHNYAIGKSDEVSSLR
jgi:AbiU2